jgi:calcineurin-like phosphoesterase family protein
MRTFITSDLHFSHKSIITFCPATRAKYGTVENMDEQMIMEWNEIVKPEDKTYIVGDLAFTSAEKATKIMNRLNGTKVLIKGNHDEKLVKNSDFIKCFESVHDYLEVNHDGHKICMFHYPISLWNQAHRGSIMAHGHLHDNLSGLEKYRVRNVGFDFTGKIVITMDELVKDALTGEIKGHH